ncbi:PAS domain-containing hybrid sensor histidine kinase/response regulator [Methylobacterium sp. J-076]|uniref:PAS domain-containing hybrid sensor histidine kinase/response regulator n=1 Tax=Methylobacterium sp. J-076 TaxID=2836655 RepID=UPI001FB980AA|nr:ATP-binding protein [Methylobacterium sp. J-076]MCJ2014614.1 ATP-binding protein [Methylobacterium sp. J-076]
MPIFELVLAAILLVLAAGVAGLSRARRWKGTVSETEEENLHDLVWRASEGEERYRTLVAATTDHVVQRDVDGRITYADEGYARLLGRGTDELLGEAIEPEILEGETVAVRDDGLRRIETRIRAADGRERWFDVVEVPVSAGEGPMQWMRAGRDITERVEAVKALDAALARAESASVAKSRFLATVSHEMRTPLNGILGMTDLLIGTGLDPEQQTYVEAVRASGKALLGLIDGILDFSRIEAGRIDLAAEPFDAAAVAEGVVELLAPRAQDKGLEIALDVAAEVPAALIGDADRFRQILLNLAGNAIKFTERGGIGVALSFGGEGLVLSVTDTGPGIPEERLPRLFEEFEQGEDNAANRHEGTGLGLAISRRLATRMGGRIDAQSRVGAGSTFRTVLPLPAAPAEAEVAQEAPRLAGRRCLIVADSPFQAPYLASALARHGGNAVIVRGLEEGLDALSAVAFDAVIADRALGDAAVRRIAEAARSCGVRRRLVLLSPFDRRDFGAPTSAGFDGYLIKPVRARSLVERLAATPTVAPPVRTAPQPAPASAGLRVLLAEDNPINTLLATRALERLGCHVVHAPDGVDAMACFRDSGPFDLALIDIRMPRLDGHEVARHIREAEAGGTSRLRLIALTANASRDEEAKAHAMGFDGFLAKPLDLKVLPELLALHRRRAA